MDDRSFWQSGREQRALHWLTQLPGAVGRVDPRRLKVHVGAVGGDGGDAAVLGVGDATTATPASHLVDALLELFAGRAGRHG